MKEFLRDEDLVEIYNNLSEKQKKILKGDYLKNV